MQVLIDERGFFGSLRRWQLQLLMKEVGLEYQPSTPATSLVRVLVDSGKISEDLAKSILKEDALKKEKANIEADKKEKTNELAKAKSKNKNRIVVPATVPVEENKPVNLGELMGGSNLPKPKKLV